MFQGGVDFASGYTLAAGTRTSALIPTLALALARCMHAKSSSLPGNMSSCYSASSSFCLSLPPFVLNHRGLLPSTAARSCSDLFFPAARSPLPAPPWPPFSHLLPPPLSPPSSSYSGMRPGVIWEPTQARGNALPPYAWLFGRGEDVNKWPSPVLPSRRGGLTQVGMSRRPVMTAGLRRRHATATCACLSSYRWY